MTQRGRARTVRTRAMTDVIWPALTWLSPVRAPPEATISRLAPGASTRATIGRDDARARAAEQHERGDAQHEHRGGLAGGQAPRLGVGLPVRRRAPWPARGRPARTVRTYGCCPCGGCWPYPPYGPAAGPGRRPRPGRRRRGSAARGEGCWPYGEGAAYGAARGVGGAGRRTGRGRGCVVRRARRLGDRGGRVGPDRRGGVVVLGLLTGGPAVPAGAGVPAVPPVPALVALAGAVRGLAHRLCLPRWWPVLWAVASI